MFRTCVSSGSRIFARQPPVFAALHTTPALSATKQTKKTGLRIKKMNLAKTAEREKLADENRPSIILGTRPGEEYKWEKCDLAKVLVDEAALETSADMIPAKMPIGTVHMPPQFAYGVDAPERQLLFETLPNASTGMAQAAAMATKGGSMNMSANEEIELRKANLLAKALDLRNANAAGIAFENRRRIIREFSTPANPFNPGLTEVQVALKTYEIRKLWKHLMSFKRDVGNRRALRKLVHDRASLLKYLKGVSLERYDTILERLALEPESVEGELVV